MTRIRVLVIGATGLSMLAALAGGGFVPGAAAVSAALAQTAAPAYAVDPLWPQPLPDAWILGSVTGVAVDARNRIWIVHRGQDSLTARTEAALDASPPGAETCCRAAPFVLAFEPTGKVAARWGGPGQGYDWPQSPGGLAVDAAGNVWIAAAGPPPGAGRGGGRGAAPGGRGAAGAAPATPPPAPRNDAHVLKFSADGKFLLQIGKPGEPGDAASRTGLNRPAGLDVDSAANEVYVADTGNRRVVVFDATTGAYKRHWGAYGTAPDATADLGAYRPDAEPAKQFRDVACVGIAADGQVYVCDRGSNRIQVFRKDGTFVREAFVSKATLGAGAVWDLAFSRDQSQQFVFVADGQSHQVTVLRRDTLAPVGTIGAGGRWPGHFYAVTAVAVDAQGNLYTGETLEGKRVQKFVRR